MTSSQSCTMCDPPRSWRENQEYKGPGIGFLSFMCIVQENMGNIGEIAISVVKRVAGVFTRGSRILLLPGVLSTNHLLTLRCGNSTAGLQPRLVERGCHICLCL